jgi:hypothetical protein
MNEYPDSSLTLENGLVTEAHTPVIQLSIHNEKDFFPTSISFGDTYLETWNNLGTVEVSQEEAEELGFCFEPEGFIPYESQGLWKKETRTVEELNEELDQYMYDGYIQSRNDSREDSDDDRECTVGIREGICKCCGTLTYDKDYSY